MARIRPTPSTTRSGTMTSTWRGTRSAETGSASRHGWTNTSLRAGGRSPWPAPRNTASGGGRDLYLRRDDDGDRGPGAAGPDDVLRRDRAAERSRQSGPRDARTEPGADLRVRHYRRQA